ncbi:MAG: hypothetical protein DSY47_01270 [Hydrogenothermus sp.]|nr:MAG: hypothetical protein DSY47_01270 [Hydrogenothermus sp.]
MLKDGIFYFEYSLKNLDDFPDSYYTNDVIIVDPKKSKKFLEKVNNLRELITTYCCLKNNNINNGIDEIISKIEEILVSVKNINYTEFVAYWKSLDVQYGTFLELSNKNNLLKILLDKFCERRRSLYEKFGYTNVSIQALYDSGSSRSKGSKFKSKILDIVRNILNTKVIFIGKNNWKEIKKELNIKYDFGRNHQNKIPDFYIVYNNHHIVGEAKHIHNKGGAQDKQVGELIDFIKQKEKYKNVHYLSFIDGLYLHHFVHKNLSEKIKRQKKDIEEVLKINPNNFFVNTKGFIKLLEDLKNA